jgi:hypothetical protein
MGNYKTAPTWLYNTLGVSKLFKTQPEVNRAWKEGWYGPPSGTENSPLISETKYGTKQMMLDATADDPRYIGCKLNMSKSIKQNRETLAAFEAEQGLSEED